LDVRSRRALVRSSGLMLASFARGSMSVRFRAPRIET
jgi:hypothetical protein